MQPGTSLGRPPVPFLPSRPRSRMHRTFCTRFALLAAAAWAATAPAPAQSFVLKGGPGFNGSEQGVQPSAQIGGQLWLAELFQFQGVVGYNQATSVEGAVYFRPFRETLVLEPFVSAGYGRYFGGGLENAVSVIPIGVGVEYDLTPVVGLTFEVIGRYTLVEDDIALSETPYSDFRAIDSGLIPTFGVNYKITQRARTIRDRLRGESALVESDLPYADGSAPTGGDGEFAGAIVGSNGAGVNTTIDATSGDPGRASAGSAAISQTSGGGTVAPVAPVATVGAPGAVSSGNAGTGVMGEAGRAAAAPGVGVAGEAGRAAAAPQGSITGEVGRAAAPVQGEVVGLAGRGYQPGEASGYGSAAPAGAVMPGAGGAVQDGSRVLVPDGTFIMGLFDEDPLRLQQSGLKRVTVSSFYVDKYEVSNREYRAWAEGQPDMQPDASAWEDAGAIVARDSYYEGASFADYPVVAVTWNQAQAYCEAQGGRLPTEAEWEYVARSGRAGGIYPWDGPEPRAANGGYLANYNPGRGGYAADGYAFTAPVAAFPSTPWGIYNIAGNVAEWTLDNYTPSYSSIGDFNPRFESEDETRHIVRGGSWDSDAFYIGVGVRTSQEADDASIYTGFRCVRELGAMMPGEANVPAPTPAPVPEMEPDTTGGN